MKEDPDRRSEDEALRRRAEEALSRRESDERPEHARDLVLLHELQVHQVELEMQNEQLRQTRDQLERSRDLYERLFDFAPVGYVTLDQEGRVHTVNLALASFLGVERGKLMRQNLTRWIVPEHQPLFLLVLQEIYGQQIPRELQILMRGADGESRWMLLRGQPVTEAAEDKGCCRLSFTDITDLLRAQQDLADLNRDLEGMVAERTALAEGRAAKLSRLTSELTLAEQRERQRLAQQLHDNLQQLLAGMGMRLELLQRRHDPEALEAQLQEVRRLVTEALDATRNLTLELSPPILRQGSLPDALRWLAGWVRQRHLLEVAARIDEAADPGRQDLRVMLFESVRELLFNVRKHAGTDCAELTAARRGALLEISVIDHGPGIDLGDRTVPSTGFGLFAIRERMEALGGGLTLRRLTEGGTEVTIRLPMQPEDVENAPAVPARLAGAGVGARATATLTTGLPPDSGKKRTGGNGSRRGPGAKLGVLLVDDHGIVREGLASMLAGEPDLEVVGQATDGREAVQASGRLMPDVVLMDVSMPNMGGEQATRLIKELLPNVRVVALSMNDEQVVIDRMRRAGADAYVTKGCRSDVLLAAIRG